MTTKLLLLLVVVIAMVGLLGWLSQRLRLGTGGSSFPYVRKQEFLSAAERSFYGVLCQVIDPGHVVIAKVRLADLVRVAPGVRGKEFWRYFNRISCKHVDFAVCDRLTLEPVYCVELDDRSHSAQGRVKRDDFVNAVMGAAGLRLVRVPCQAAYALEEVRMRVGA